MARWFVGQPVRKARPSVVPGEIKVGAEGRILELNFRPAGSPAGDGVLPQDSDCVVNYQNKYYRSHTDLLEPILPEGMQPVSWSECLWKPEGEKVS